MGTHVRTQPCAHSLCRPVPNTLPCVSLTDTSTHTLYTYIPPHTYLHIHFIHENHMCIRNLHSSFTYSPPFNPPPYLLPSQHARLCIHPHHPHPLPPVAPARAACPARTFKGKTAALALSSPSNAAISPNVASLSQFVGHICSKYCKL